MMTRPNHPFRVRARADLASRSTYGGTGLDDVQGPRRFDFWSNAGRAIKKGVKDTGNAVKKGVVDTGHAVGTAASNPLVQGALATGLALTGVGAPAAAGIMAATKGGGALLKPGGNIGQGITGAAKGAALGYGAAKAGSLVKGAIGAIGGGGSAGGAIPNASGGSESDPYGDGRPTEFDPLPNAPGGGSESDPYGDGRPGAPDPNGGGGTSWADTLLKYGGDAAKAAAAFAKEHGQTALELLAIKNAADRQTQADKYATGALKGTEERFAAKQGLRDTGISGMMNPGNGADLSNLKAIANAPRDLSSLKNIAGAQSGNPFADAIPNASASGPVIPQSGPAIPNAPPYPVLPPGTHPATGMRPLQPLDQPKPPAPNAPYDPRASRMNSQAVLRGSAIPNAPPPTAGSAALPALPGVPAGGAAPLPMRPVPRLKLPNTDDDALAWNRRDPRFARAIPNAPA